MKLALFDGSTKRRGSELAQCIVGACQASGVALFVMGTLCMGGLRYPERWQFYCLLALDVSFLK